MLVREDCKLSRFILKNGSDQVTQVVWGDKLDKALALQVIGKLKDHYITGATKQDLAFIKKKEIAQLRSRDIN